MNENELNDLLGNLNKIVPTLLVIGMTADGHGVLFMGSPGNNEREMRMDLCTAIAPAIAKNKKLQEVLYSVVLQNMQENSKYAEAMHLTLKQTSKLLEHFADASKMMDKTKN